jgi:hypothetical protein
MRRLERQHLAARLQRGLDLGQRRTGTRGEHQFARFVFDAAASRAAPRMTDEN